MKQPIRGIRRARLCRGDETPIDIVDLQIDDGKIVKIGRDLWKTGGDAVIDAEGKYLLHGFYDIGCRFRFEEGTFSESAESSLSSARAGGFCRLLAFSAPADGLPVFPFGGYIKTVPSVSSAKEVMHLGRGVYVEGDGMGSLTMPLIERYLLFRAIAETGSLLLTMPFDRSFASGAVRAGAAARVLNLGGVPAASEVAALSRDIALAGETGAKVHFMGISSAESVELIRLAKEKGYAASVGVSPCHLAMTADDIPYHGVNAKVLPPLGEERDRKAICRGLLDGTIDCIHSFHRPMGREDKGKDIRSAPFGASAIDITAGVAMTYLQAWDADSLMMTIARSMASRPAEILGERGIVEEGTPVGALILVSPQKEMIVSSDILRSRGLNCPFLGLSLSGMAETLQ